MRALKELLSDKLINSLTVAILIGFSTLSFINSVGSMAMNYWFKTGSSTQWVWKVFWGYAILYAIALIVARFIRTLENE